MVILSHFTALPGRGDRPGAHPAVNGVKGGMHRPLDSAPLSVRALFLILDCQEE